MKSATTAARRQPVEGVSSAAAASRGDIISRPHAHAAETIAEALGVDSACGLTGDEAAARLKRDGPNELQHGDEIRWWAVLLAQFKSIVVWLLLAAGVIAALTDALAEAAAIGVVLLINALLGFAIEMRAGKALEALRRSTPLFARVRRSGLERTVDSRELVIGDIVSVTAGDRVPADVRLLEAAEIRADESSLTGESVPVHKSVEAVESSSVLAERRSMLYLGTMISSGRGLGVITATGAATELGRVGELLAKTRSEETPLERRLAAMGRLLVYIVLGVAGLVTIAGVIRGNGVVLMIEVAISLAVAAVPEALPAMTTLILALGVLRMAKERAIVRKLAAVEALGSTSVICTDKTGTLTENRMTVIEYRLPSGETVAVREQAVPDAMSRLLRVSVLCNDAAGDLASEAVGDPTEFALLVAAQEIGADVHALRERYRKLLERPFSPAAKRMITVVQDGPDGEITASLKGGPSVVLSMCSSFADQSGAETALTGDQGRRLLTENEEMAARGLRVLAFADKRLVRSTDDIESGYTFLGFAGMTDPLRSGAKQAVRAAKDAGIRVVMLTGDQMITARAIAGDLGLSDGDGDIYSAHASDVSAWDEAALADAASRAHVFARVSPEDKLRIVESLQNIGEIVAVTGDGVNDAPALKRSDVGIAMGMRGTEVAKDAADIILTDDNFSTIVKAIEGGRTIYANIIKFVHLMFSHNLGEVLVIFGAIAAGLPLPLLPLQILWLNIITDIFPALALAVEPASPRIMKYRPRPADETLLSRRFLVLIGWQGAMLAAMTVTAYLWALDQYGEGAHARTVALLAFVGVQFGHTFNCRSRTRSTFDRFFSNPYLFLAGAIVIALQAAAFAIGPLRELLELAVPTPSDLVATLLCVIAPVVVVELTKLRRRLPASPPR